jgi:hypothetical protein
VSISLFSRFPFSVEEFAEFCSRHFDWEEVKCPVPDSRRFAIPADDDEVWYIDIWQSGSFIQASTSFYVGEYLEHFFVTPDDGDEFNYCENLHLLSLRDNGLGSVERRYS